MAPGRVEDAKGVPFSGPAGNLLRNELRRQGIDPRLAYFMNAVCCMPPGNKVKATYLDACRVNLKDQWDTADAEWVLVCGNTALEALMPNATPHARHKIIEIHGKKLWPIFHPSYVLRAHENVTYRGWQESILTFRFVMETGGEFKSALCIYCGQDSDYNHPPVCKKDMGKWRIDSKWRYSPPPQMRLEL